MANGGWKNDGNSKLQTPIARLLIDPPATGSWNMAVDQMLLDEVDSPTLVTLRIYGWTPATLSLGYFQKASEREQHVASRSLDMVRRASGGGAIVHDQELTYSLFVGTSHRWAYEHQRLYDMVHKVVIESLAQFDVQADLYRASGAETESQKPFLCFERRAEGDLVLGGYKVGGSAQRRSRTAVLQHGSLLIAQSQFAPELLGIEELTGISIDRDRLTRLIRDGIENSLGVKFEDLDLSTNQKAMARKYQVERFGDMSWTRNR